MRKLLLSAALSGALLASVAGTALAGSDNQLTSGEPGDKNCVGQTRAWMTQGNWKGDGPGFGNLASQNDVTVKEFNPALKAFCGS